MKLGGDELQKDAIFVSGDRIERSRHAKHFVQICNY